MTDPVVAADRLYSAFCWMGVTFGAAQVLATRPFLQAYSLTDHSPQSVHLTRLAGTRLITLAGVGLLVTPTEDRRRAAIAVAAMHTVDAMLAATADRAIPARARTTSALTSAASAITATVLLRTNKDQ